MPIISTSFPPDNLLLMIYRINLKSNLKNWIWTDQLIMALPCMTILLNGVDLIKNLVNQNWLYFFNKTHLKSRIVGYILSEVYFTSLKPILWNFFSTYAEEIFYISQITLKYICSSVNHLIRYILIISHRESSLEVINLLFHSSFERL